MSGGKGGRETSEVKIPEWLEAAARENLARGQAVANIGYTPYYGPDVAAMTPMQLAAIQGTSSAAGAFGLPGGGMTGMEGMPTPQTFAGGVQGYSSGGLYDQALAELQTRRPGQYNAITGMFIDPYTGAAPSLSFAPEIAPLPTIASNPLGFGNMDGGRGEGPGRAAEMATGGRSGTTSMNTPGSYAPGGINTRNPGSLGNRVAAAATSRSAGPTAPSGGRAASRPETRSSQGKK